jgi:hypothetical protein
MPAKRLALPQVGFFRVIHFEENYTMAKSTIPGGITPEHFLDIRKYLSDILEKTGAMVVNMRLNETGEICPAPVFVGWVESQDLAKKRASANRPDPGLFRFADTIRSKEYTETVLARGAIRERDWRVQISQKSSDQKKDLPASGVIYQKFIGIMVDQRCVGALNLGFSRKPDNKVLQNAENVMKFYAKNPRSELITFLNNNFKLGAILTRRA